MAALDGTLDQDAVDLDRVAALVVDAHGAAPCAVVGAALYDQGWRFGWGSAGRLSREGGSVSQDALFDLASLTKPFTALALARCQRAGIIDRNEPLAACLPQLADTPSGPVSLDLLSAHRAGLEAHIEMFVAAPGAVQPDRAAVLERAARGRRGECRGAPPPGGFAAVYSDLGYMLLGAALESRSGLSMDALVRREVVDPLGLKLGSARQLAPRAAARFVPTERVDWRGGVLCGVAHDENAWILAGHGSAGHAGLFGDAWSLVRVGTAIVDALRGRDESWLTQTALLPLIERRARAQGAEPGISESHAAGFTLSLGSSPEGSSLSLGSSPEGSSLVPASGSRFGEHTFGHLGFTGTSLWIDPERELVGVLLTNRVHPSRDHLAIRAARPAAYDLIYDTMTA